MVTEFEGRINVFNNSTLNELVPMPLELLNVTQKRPKRQNIDLENFKNTKKNVEIFTGCVLDRGFSLVSTHTQMNLALSPRLFLNCKHQYNRTCLVLLHTDSETTL